VGFLRRDLAIELVDLRLELPRPRLARLLRGTQGPRWLPGRADRFLRLLLRLEFELGDQALLGGDVRMLGAKPQLHLAQLVARRLELIDRARRTARGRLDDADRLEGGRIRRISRHRVGDRLLQDQPAIAIAVDRLADVLNLGLHPLDYL